MISRLKQYFWLGLVVAVFYFLLNHHFIIFSYKDFELLKKAEPTLEYTFYSLKQANPLTVLQNDVLVDAGIEDIMLERGMVTEQRLIELYEHIDQIREYEERQMRQ